MTEEVIERALFRGPMDELELLLSKIRESEDLVRRAEEFFNLHHREWSVGLAMQFEVFLERKRDQIHFERAYAEKLGWRIALDQDTNEPDI